MAGTAVIYDWSSLIGPISWCVRRPYQHFTADIIEKVSALLYDIRLKSELALSRRRYMLLVASTAGHKQCSAKDVLYGVRDEAIHGRRHPPVEL